jgi:hypothetical protein
MYLGTLTLYLDDYLQAKNFLERGLLEWQKLEHSIPVNWIPLKLELGSEREEFITNSIAIGIDKLFTG